jgi:hypothetical protein
MWCYVGKQNCNLPDDLKDVTPAVIDEGYTGSDQLAYSYGTCGTASTYAKFRQTANLNASGITPVIENYVSSERDYIEQQLHVIATTEGDDICEWYDSCPCADCSPGGGSWKSLVNTNEYSIVTNKMTISHSTGVDTNSADARHTQCLLRLVEARLKMIILEEYDDPTRMGWLMWGDQKSGMWAGLPGIQWCPGSDWDPRFRPWYVSAVSGPKDVVIILDRSASMNAHNRKTLAISAAEAVLDTLSEWDKVGIIIFSTSAETYNQQSALIEATHSNVAQIKTWLQDIAFMGATDFKAAFTKAFQLIKYSSTTSNCNGMVLFLTDGVDDSGVQVSEITELNTKNYTIFTYSFGAEAEAEKPKEIACANHGIWHSVPDGGDVKDAMANYFQYYAEGNAYHKQIRWTKYDEIDTKRPLMTGCLPAYNRSSSPPLLLGVFCMDVNVIIPLSEFEAKPDYYQAWTTMQNQAKQCTGVVSYHEPELERLREEFSASSTCAATGIDVSSSRGCDGRVRGLLGALWVELLLISVLIVPFLMADY